MRHFPIIDFISTLITIKIIKIDINFSKTAIMLYLTTPNLQKITLITLPITVADKFETSIPPKIKISDIKITLKADNSVHVKQSKDLTDARIAQ